MSKRRVFVTAPAKVNLYLAVGEVRADGYHDVTTVLSAIGLRDELVIAEADSLSVRTEPELSVPEEENLAHRAAVALARRAGVRSGAAIELAKAIPSGAGLGGGSSDAAAALLGLDALWGLGLPPSTLAEVAVTLGADVPFFLSGGNALYDGRGDRFVRTLSAPRFDIAVVRPDVPVPTGAAYTEFDRIPHEEPPALDALIAALDSDSASKAGSALFNNMTDASIRLVPAVADVLLWLRERPGVAGAAMAGSGSAVFGICRDAEAARLVAREAGEQGWWSVATHTIAEGARVTVEGGVS